MKDIVKDFINQTEQAIETKSFNRWMEIFSWDDDVYIEAQKDWFNSKFVNRDVRKIHLDVLEQDINQSNIYIKALMFLEYENGISDEETYLYKLECSDDQEDWSVVGFEKEKRQFGKEDFDSDKEVYFDKRISGDSYGWWKDSEILSLIDGSEDPESAGMYARSISRNIRFREAHPVLESASILTNMMSLRLCRYIFKVYSRDKYRFLVNAYNAFKNSYQVKLIRDDRDNTWNSKYVAPWYGFDELFQKRDENGTIYGSCNSYMSFMTAILRLGGFDDENIYQMRLGNQDIVLINDESDYLLTSDGLEQINEYTSYYKKNINKVFNDQWYITQPGEMNLEDSECGQICKNIKEKLPFLEFELSDRRILKNARLKINIPQLEEFYSADELCRYIKKKVLKLSKKNPRSVFTWAKYAYQTIYVMKPEVYAAWSVQNGMTRNFMDEFSTDYELIDYLKKLKDNSIFPEDDRIMTADQVIRHGTASGKDRALFLFTWYKYRKNSECAVILTDKGNYTAYKEENDWIIVNSDLLKRVDSIDFDSVYAAFDDKNSICSFNSKSQTEKDDVEWKKLLNI